MTQGHAIVYPLFSTPVYHIEDTGFRTSKLLLDKLLQLSRSSAPGLSEDRFVLRLPYMSEVKSLVEYHLKNYVTQVCGITESFEVTNSWITVNTGGVDHYRHLHPNSIFSGTLYLQADEGSSPIKFHGKRKLTSDFNFTWNISEQNIYNSENWTVPTQTGTLTIFPSTLEHSAPQNASRTPRICLGFNTFVRADFGDKSYASDIDLTGIKNYYD